MPELVRRKSAMKHKLSVMKDFSFKRLCLINKCTVCDKRLCTCTKDHNNKRNDFSGSTMAAVPEPSWPPHRQHPVTAYSSSCQRRTSSVSRASCRSASGYRERSGSVPPSGGDLTLRYSPDSQWTDGMVGLQEPGSRGTVYMRHDPLQEAPSNNHLFLGLSDSEGQPSEDSSGGGGTPSTSQTCSEDEGIDDYEPCHPISLEERLLKTYPIWYLPDLQRSGAIHLLQGKEDGMFLVRQSSKPDTLALSVRLPPDKGPHIQHYLIEIHNSGAQYSLEASENKFDSPPSLIAYYSNCCDELPVTLKLPLKVQEAKTRCELASIALLGQEFWITSMTGSASSTPSSDAPPRSIAPSPSPRPLDLAFSSFGKSGITRGTSHTSLLSPHTPCGVPPSPLTPCGILPNPISNGLSHGNSTSSLAPTRPPLPHFPSSGDRSSLNLNLTSLDDILKDQPTFSSFRSHPPTPLTPLKPNPPPRHSPPGTQVQPARPSPPARTSPSNSISKDCSPMTSAESEEGVNGQPPTPPVRWARPSITSSSSNITVTTTLTFNVNPVQAFALTEDNSFHSPQGSQCQDDLQDQAFQVQVSSLEISPSGNSITSQPPTNMTGSGIMNRHREGLKLQIHQSIGSPQSTPCTPGTPLGTPLSEENEGRVKMRRKKDRRRHSNHYHEANIVDDTRCYRSSLADKISDYEDLWSSPPRDISTEASSPREGVYKMSTFKPRSEISKSLGDLTDINQANKAVVFSYEHGKLSETFYDNKHLNGINGNSSDSVNSYRKNSSPFYIDPADALLEPERKASIKKASSKLSRKITNRYSDSNIQWRSRKSHHLMQKIESNEAINGISSSVENLSNIENEQNAINSNHYMNGHGIPPRSSGRGKPVNPPRIDALGNVKRSILPWRVDSSWEYVTYDSDCGDDSNGEGRFPVGDKSGETDSIIIPGEKTVRDLISEKLPNMCLPDTQSITYSHTTRISEYDNVARLTNREGTKLPPPSPHFPSTVSDSGTEFSEPWDSRKWDSILHGGDDTSLDQFNQSCSNIPSRPAIATDDSDIGVTDSDSLIPGDIPLGGSDEETTSSFAAPTLSLSNSNNLNTNLRSRILSPQMLALRHRQDAESGTAIRKYALDLGGDKSTTFSQAVSNFITCTLETNERDPAVIVRNVRQFMSGMKNYLVRSGEKEFQATLKKERSNLKSTEFLNLDAILEDVLVRLVLRPLWNHITNLYIDYYTTNGSIQRLTTNIKYAKSVQYTRLGIRPELIPPKGAALDAIKALLKKMQRVYAPREKLEHLLGAVSHIYHAMYESNEGEPASGDADDLVPMIMWVLSQAGIVSAEVEADYMSGLLLPSSASGEASYYLTAFHSAIHSLKNLTPSPESSPGNSLSSVKYDNSTMPDQLVLKIMVPDEKNGSIVTRTVPIKPGITTREVCKMMALKMKVTNPQDYGLYKLVDGQESILADNECPHKIKTDLGNHGYHCLIAFKRIDAKIAWPILES